MWEPHRLATLWAFTVCYRDTFTFFLPLLYSIFRKKILKKCMTQGPYDGKYQDYDILGYATVYNRFFGNLSTTLHGVTS
jgi:hypothetical protein